MTSSNSSASVPDNHNSPASEPVITPTATTDELATLVYSLQNQLAQQNLKVAQLEAKLQAVATNSALEVKTLKTSLPVQISASAIQTAPAPAPASFNARRRFLKNWGQVAAGLAAGVGAATLAGSQPASAASGENLILGRSNLISTSTYLSQLPGSLTNKPIFWSDWHATGKSTEPAVSAAVAGTADTNGVGGYFSGGRAPILLSPGATTPPTTGTHATGELFVSSTGELYICTNNTTNAPIWRKFSSGPSLTLLDYPTRFIDTRFQASTNGGDYGTTTTGLATGVHTYTLPLTSMDGVTIPSGIVGIFGSLQAVTIAGPGSIKIFPGNLAESGYSVVSYSTSGTVESGVFCIKLPTNGQFKVSVVTNSANFTLELFGYYT